MEQEELLDTWEIVVVEDEDDDSEEYESPVKTEEEELAELWEEWS